jgi:hypothetical protein
MGGSGRVLPGGAVVHEIVHVLAWKFRARVAWSAMSVRMSRRKLGVFAQLGVPVPACDYRVLIGLAAGSGLFVAWGRRLPRRSPA